MSAPLRVLTVRQPWASAIIFGGKDVENRPWSTAYQGEVAIHAGLEVDGDALSQFQGLGWPMEFGRIIGVVDLVGAHTAGLTCCDSQWGESRGRHELNHLVLANPRPLTRSYRFTGSLGLRRLPDHAAELVRAEVSS